MDIRIYLCIILLCEGVCGTDEDVLRKLLFNFRGGYGEEDYRETHDMALESHDDVRSDAKPIVNPDRTMDEETPPSDDDRMVHTETSFLDRDSSDERHQDGSQQVGESRPMEDVQSVSEARESGMVSETDTESFDDRGGALTLSGTAPSDRDSSLPELDPVSTDRGYSIAESSDTGIQNDGVYANHASFSFQKLSHPRRDHEPATWQWFGQTGRDFHGWRDELNFPGSGYVLEMIDDHLTKGLYLEAEIQDPFKVNSILIETIASDIDDVTSVLRDPDVLALIYTRRMTSYIQQDRMLCAAAKFDMISMQAMMTEINNLFADDDDSMEDFLLTLLDDLPSVPDQQWTTETLAYDLSLRIHDMLFNDTIHYLLGRSYRDVTMFSRGLYKSLQKFFRSQYVSSDTFVAIVTDMLIYDSNVHCPTDAELKMYRRDAMWDLTTSLEAIETTELCMGMRSFIESNFVTMGTTENKMASDYERSMGYMCAYVNTYVGHMYMNVKEYERVLMQRDPDELKNMFQKFLTTKGLLTLVSVLEKLRWTPSLAVVDNIAPTTKLNGTLPAGHVIDNVRNDINFWQSFLDTLTPEAFSRMNLLHFKQSIEEWLDQKHKLVKDYTSNLLQ